MQGKQLDPIPLLLPLNLLLLVPFGHLLEKVKTKVLERWCALPLSLLYSFSAAAVTASWQLHTVNRFMKAMCIQALPSTLLSCQEQNNLGNVYSSRSIHIVYVYSSPCVHIHHVYLSSTFFFIKVRKHCRRHNEPPSLHWVLLLESPHWFKTWPQLTRTNCFKFQIPNRSAPMYTITWVQ